MLRRRHRLPPVLWAAAVLTVGIGCASIAGLDATYTLGDTGTAAVGAAAGNGGTGNTAATGGTDTGGSSDAGAGASAGAGGDTGCLGEGGLAPCADPDCAAAYECAPAVPPGFSGPYRVRSVGADPAPTPQPCNDGSSPDLFFRGVGEPASCSACACDDASASCSLPTVRYFSDQSDCGGASSVIMPDGSCQVFSDICSACNRARSMHIEAPSHGEGSCTPSGGAAQLPAMWQLETHLCDSGADAGGCIGAGELCIPTGTEAYASPPCIAQAGVQSCPGAYPETYTIYTGGTDSRDCTSCACDPPACTAGTFTLYDAGGCALGGEAPLVIGTACSGDIRAWVDESVASYEVAEGTLQGCTPTGGIPSGGVDGQGETTLCCVAPLVDP